MSKVLIYERADGGISTRFPAYKDPMRSKTQSDEELYASIDAATIPQLDAQYGPGTIRHTVEDTDLPEPNHDQYFFNAWCWLDRKCQVNMLRAQDVHMDHIRKVRDIELAKESGSPFRQPPELEEMFTPERNARLQVLRDIPQTFDLATPNNTLDELKALWPTELPPRG